MAILNPEQREKLDNFRDSLRKRIPNYDILSHLLVDLDSIYEPDGGIIFINEGKIEFVDDNGGLYFIFINPNSIVETYKRKTGNYLEKTEVTFKDNFVSVRKDSTACPIHTEMPEFVQRRTNITDYKDNQVVHEHKFFTSCSTSVDLSSSFTEESETFVSSTRTAYIREMTIDANGSSNVSYLKSNSYNPRPFNDLEVEYQEKEPFIYESNENEYTTSTARLR